MDSETKPTKPTDPMSASGKLTFTTTSPNILVRAETFDKASEDVAPLRLHVTGIQTCVPVDCKPLPKAGARTTDGIVRD